MKLHRAAVAMLVAAPLFAGGAAEAGAQLRSAELDPNECYRMREIHLTREDLRFYFTDGWVVFGKPVAGKIISAVFVINAEAGDAELLVMPPTTGERTAMAAFTGAPNLDEHFLAALMLFTDDTAAVLKKAIEARGDPQKSPERGLLIAEGWNRTVGNIASSFSTRLVQHLIQEVPPEQGVFYAAIQGRKLGNFDAYHDPEATDSIYLGQLKNKEDRTFYDTWTAFVARSQRGPAKRMGLSLALADYRIEAAMDQSLHIKAVTQVTATPQRGPLRVLAFDLSGRMQVSSVRINGEEAEVYRRESLRSDLLRASGSVMFLVVPPRPLEVGRSYEIVFEHEGDVISEAGNKVYYVGGRGNWYPRHGIDFTRYDITFTHPSRLQLVFPGDIKEDKTEGEERRTRRVTPAPIRIAGFNLGDYESVKATRGPLTVEVYANRTVEAALAPRREVVMMPPAQAPPLPRRGPMRARPEVVALPPPPVPDPTERLATLATEIAGGYEYFAAHFGPPALPTLMVSPIPGTFGQGYPGLVYLSTMSYLDPRDRPANARDSGQQTFFSEILHAHETAHQWWGNVVAPASIQDEWLLEALANYSALLYLEKRKGGKAAAAVLDEYRQQLLKKDEEGRLFESAGPIMLGQRLQNSVTTGAWRTIVYGKGTWIVHMLRRRLGDEKFLQLLGEVAKKYRNKPLTIAEFQRMAASYLPPRSEDPKLERFFEHWVDGTGIPEITMTHSVKGKAPRVELAVTITAKEIDEKSAVSVPVQVQLARGKTETRWVLAGADAETLKMNLTAPPVKVALDPDYSLLRR